MLVTNLTIAKGRGNVCSDVSQVKYWSKFAIPVSPCVCPNLFDTRNVVTPANVLTDWFYDEANLVNYEFRRRLLTTLPNYTLSMQK